MVLCHILLIDSDALTIELINLGARSGKCFPAFLYGKLILLTGSGAIFFSILNRLEWVRSLPAP